MVQHREMRAGLFSIQKKTGAPLAKNNILNPAQTSASIPARVPAHAPAHTPARINCINQLILVVHLQDRGLLSIPHHNPCCWFVPGTFRSVFFASTQGAVEAKQLTIPAGHSPFPPVSGDTVFS